MTTDVEIVIVGGGVIGLAIAREMSVRGREVMLIERHRGLGQETSSRNSEVLHAGIYYPPGSLRARMCVAGRRRLAEFAADNGVVVRPWGKLLVASSEAELPRLRALADNAARNGVDDLVPLDAASVRQLEPELNAVAAVLSPSTAVIDSHGVMLALEGHVSNAGGTIALDTHVTAMSRVGDEAFALTTRNGSDGRETVLTARRVVIAAGLGSADLARSVDWPDGYTPPAMYPAKGHYFTLSGRAPFRHLVYPMPVGAWLGLHLTLDVAGAARFGPDIQWVDRVDYAFDDPDGRRRETFEREIRRYWPGLPDGALQPGYTGVRPKIYREGQPAADFTIHGSADHGIPGLVALYGIESPGLTSCLAIADHVSDLIDRAA
jgi:L-2-hydroxyglutarate oxidase LhgO